MSVREATKTKAVVGADRSGRLFLLDLSGGRVLSMDPDGSDRKIIATDCHHPDGIVVDVEAGHVYWTNMGVPSLNDGSIERADLDGKNRKFIVAPGGTFTPKQLHLDKANGKLYWCDREGMRVMRCNLDGSQIETLVQTGDGEADRRDQTRWCVGIAIDPQRGTDLLDAKGPRQRRSRAHLARRHRHPDGRDGGQSQRHRGLLRRPARADRSRARSRKPHPLLDRPRRSSARQHGEPRADRREARANAPQIVVSDLMEGIGIALDVPGNRMFVTDLAGSLYSAKLDGTDKRTLLAAQGNLTGIAYAEI